MATQVISRSLPKTLILASVFSRSFSSTATATATLSASSYSSFSLLRRLRPLASIVATDFRRFSPTTIVRDLATRATSSSLNDPNPNWSNRPPKETILLEGCDFEHWLVVVEKPEGDPTRDEIIDSYIKTLAMVLGSEEEARMKIYSVSTRCYFAFGCLVSEEISYKIKELPKVRWVLPDSYLDVKNKDYGGEPFIDGHAVPYDPKYHEEWIRNNARANERNRRNDRPRNFDRSRNFERRRDFQNTGPNMGGAPQNNMGGAPQNNMGGAPQNNMGGPPPNNNFVGVPPRSGMPPPNYGGMPQNNMGGMSPNNYGGAPPPPNNYGGAPQPSNNYGGGAPPPPNNYGGGAPPPPNNYGGGAPPPPNNYGGGAPPPPSNFGGAPRPPPPSNYGGGAPPPPSNYGGAPPGNYVGGAPPSNYGGAPPTNGGGFPPQSHYREMHSNTGWSSNKVSE